MEPPLNDPGYEKWEAENLTVMSWLLHSMQPQISWGLLFIRTEKRIWNTVNQTYAQTHNLARISQLSQEIAHHRQGERSLSDYYSSLRGMWEELSHYQPISSHCAEDAAVPRRGETDFLTIGGS